MDILLFSLLILSGLAIPRWWRRLKILRWQRVLALNKHQAVFNRLFAGVDGYTLSRQARKGRDAIEYTYGEIVFVPFISLLSLVKPDSNTVFYDLGSGVGKAVFACAMVFNVNRSCGVELFSTLHDAASEQLSRIGQLPDYQAPAKKIHFINDNFLHTNFSDATLIFINASAFFGETWFLLNQRLAELNPEVTIITTTKKLSSDFFIVTQTTKVQMSWGVVNTYIHRHIAYQNF